MAPRNESPEEKLTRIVRDTVKGMFDERDRAAAEEKDPEARALRRIREIVGEVMDERLGPLTEGDDEGRGRRRRGGKKDDDEEGEEPKLGILGL